MTRRPPSGTRLAAMLAIALAVLGAGCANRAAAPVPSAAQAPAAPVDRPVAIDATPAVEQWERRQRERAELAQRQGRWAEAVQQWDVLQTLRPGKAEYGERLADAQRQQQALAAERLARAQAAHKRNELDGAAQLYLAALALSPEHEAAAEGLRAVERERNKRNHVGKLARNTLVRRPADDAAARTTQAPRPAPRATGDRNEVEHAAMLASQGELDDAIALLQAHLGVQRNDAEAKRLLADLQAQKSERAAGGARENAAPPAKAPRKAPAAP